MRKQFCDAMVDKSQDSKLVFLTGDLGFMALEPLQEVLAKRFINVGISEQNMVSVAAALSKEGFDVWTYSIAPFIYARPFEQIRNDITFHALPVKLVGNGGGYGYGVMGPTHHAIEDYGILLTLPNMRVYIPVFDEDVVSIISKIDKIEDAIYLRLGRGEAPSGFVCPEYAPWRCLVEGNNGVLIAVGPLAGTYISALQSLSVQKRPSLWALSELPLQKNPIPRKIIEQIKKGGTLCVAEEHVAQGSVGASLGYYLIRNNLQSQKFIHHFAQAHHYERYGSQIWLREQSQLDSASVIKNFI